jgi:hypothetical protein
MKSALFAFALLAAVPALAQQGRGTILGTVSDSTGAVVAGAKVSVLDVDTNNAAIAETNKDGFYTTPPLVVGRYRVTVEHAGFKKAVRSGIVLEVDDKAEINFQLDLGSATESVVVTAEAPMINTENGSLGQVIGNDFVNDLPLDGGNALALVLLAADVHSNAGPVQSGFADRGTSLSDLSINGGPNAANNLLVDGMVAQNSYYPDLNANLGVDAVQEFKVQSGSMSAEYGFTLGGVINMATKGGTNILHGGASEFFRNDFLDARNAFSIVWTPATPSPSSARPTATTSTALPSAAPSFSPSSTTAATGRSSSSTGANTTTSLTATPSRPSRRRSSAPATSPTSTVPPARSFPSTTPLPRPSIPPAPAISAPRSPATSFRKAASTP